MTVSSRCTPATTRGAQPVPSTCVAGPDTTICVGGYVIWAAKACGAVESSLSLSRAAAVTAAALRLLQSCERAERDEAQPRRQRRCNRVMERMTLCRALMLCL